MKRTLLATAVAISLFTLAGCQDNNNKQEAAEVSAVADVQLESVIQRASYGIGRDMGANLVAGGLKDADIDALAQGMRDAMDEQPSRVSDEDLEAAFEELHRKAVEEMQARYADVLKENEAFLAEHATQEGVVTTESGLQYKVLKAVEGDAPRPVSTDLVRVHYEGRLKDGSLFDSSRERGRPSIFPVNGVIDAWEEALQLMKVGETWSIAIPSELAYGEDSPTPSIPPHSVLLFEMELLEIVAPEDVDKPWGEEAAEQPATEQGETE